MSPALLSDADVGIAPTPDLSHMSDEDLQAIAAMPHATPAAPDFSAMSDEELERIANSPSAPQRSTFRLPSDEDGVSPSAATPKKSTFRLPSDNDFLSHLSAAQAGSGPAAPAGDFLS